MCFSTWTDLRRDPPHVEPSDRLAIELDHVELGVIVRGMVTVLRGELVRDERGLLRVIPRYGREFVLARGAIQRGQKRVVRLRQRTERHRHRLRARREDALEREKSTQR